MEVPKTGPHINYCDEVIAGSTGADAYRKYVARGKMTAKSISSHSSKLTKRYTEYIQAKKKEYRELAQQSFVNTEHDKIAFHVISAAQVDQALGEIILSNHKLVRDPVSKQVVKVDNTVQDKLKAIDMYYKRYGLYVETDQQNAGKKIDISIDREKLKRYSDDEILKYIEGAYTVDSNNGNNTGPTSERAAVKR